MQDNRSGWERLCSTAGPINHILIEHWMLFQAAWQIGMALVTPHSNTCSASFSFTSFIKSPGNTHKPLSPGCPHRFFSACWMFRCPLIPPINTLLISQQKPALNLKIPFSVPVKRSPSGSLAVHKEGCAPGELWQCCWRAKVTANVTGDATLPPQGKPRESLHGYNRWELLTHNQSSLFKLVFKDKTLTFWLVGEQ